MNKVELITKEYIKKNVPQLRAGDTVRVYERIKEGDKERIQVFEGLVLYTKHGTKTTNATFTVRKISVHRVGVEKTFLLHSPKIQKIEVVKHDKVRRAKLYYVRDLRGKKKKRKASQMLGVIYEEEIEATPEEPVDVETQKTEAKSEESKEEAVQSTKTQTTEETPTTAEGPTPENADEKQTEETPKEEMEKK